MADATKYAPINGGTLITDLKSQFHFLKAKKTVVITYGFMFAFIAFTIFLAFSPSSNSSSPWFTNIFSIGSSSSSGTGNPSGVFSDESYRSHFSSIYSYFFPNSTQRVHNSTFQASPANVSGSKNTTFEQSNFNKVPSIVNNQTQNAELQDKVGALKPNQSVVSAPKSPPVVNQTVNTAPKSPAVVNQTTNTAPKSPAVVNQTVNTAPKSPAVVNQTLNATPKSSSQLNKEAADGKNKTQSTELDHKVEVLKANQTTIGVTGSPVKANKTRNSSPESFSGVKNATKDGEKRIAEKGIVKNLTSSLVKKQSNGTNLGGSAKQGRDELVKYLVNCNIFDGNWMMDDSYPLYKPGSCPLIDEQFNCFVNGRPDTNYDKFRWKPKGCTLPRLDGRHMLDLLRGKRLVFVGDSLNRNMWESLVCILRNSVKDQKKVYEASGRHHFRAEASYSFVFEDYKFTVEFFVSPFLVQEWEVQDKSGKKKETLRLDLVGESADKYKDADIIIFNTGHWWTHEKTSLGKDYYQEGSHVYSDLNVLEAFRRALTTWARWVDANINPARSLVFFRGYSASHFSGGQWNSGGACDHETEPIKNETYLSEYPDKMTVLESVFKGMKTHVSYMNITRMTDYRKDGHPSMYRHQNLSDEERRSPMRYQDCSHWCLPGVPDAWNEIVYAELLLNEHMKQQQQGKT